MDLRNSLIQFKCFLHHSSIWGNSRAHFRAKAKMLECYVDQKWNQNNGYNEVNCNIRINDAVSKYKGFGFHFEENSLDQARRLCDKLEDFINLSAEFLESTKVPRLLKNNIEIMRTLSTIFAKSNEFDDIDTWRELSIDSFTKQVVFEGGVAVSDHCKNVFIPSVRQYAQELFDDYNKMLIAERAFGWGEF